MDRKKFAKTYRIIENTKKEKSRTDPAGSWTGKPKDFAYPVQDVDDL